MSPEIEFLTARYNEDEAAIRQLLAPGWTHDGTPSPTLDEPLARVRGWTLTLGHLLADIAAKRAILAMHVPNPSGSAMGPFCQVCDTAGGRYPCDTVCHLLQPFAEHPDFDPAWRVA